jgi:transcriptional regulator with XRE-family HTH domain
LFLGKRAAASEGRWRHPPNFERKVRASIQRKALPRATEPVSMLVVSLNLKGLPTSDTPHRMNIGNRLHELRAVKGFSQGDMERRTGILRTYLSRVENGHTLPNLETLEKLAGALEIELYQLFFAGEGKPQPVGSRETGRQGPDERELFEAFKSLNKKDRKVLVATARMMANGKRPAKRKT